MGVLYPSNKSLALILSYQGHEYPCDIFNVVKSDFKLSSY